MKKSFLIIILLFLMNVMHSQEYFIDWVTGKIYSYAVVDVVNNYDFAYNRLDAVNKAKEVSKINFYRILDRINFDESLSLLKYFEERADKNRELFTLVDNSKLFKIEYPSLNTIKIAFFIDIYGKNSLMSILMTERESYTEELKGYMGYHYNTEFTGVIIDARGELTSFDGYKVTVKPSLFVVIRDSEGRVVMDKNNVYPEIIMNSGMVRYSYDINQDHSDLIGKNPLRIVASGTGDRAGSHIVISLNSAKKMLSSEVTRKSLQSGKLVIIIDK